MFDGYDKKPLPMPISHPKFGGLAIWANSLIVRIKKAKQAIDSLYFIPEHHHAAEAIEKYEKLLKSLENFIISTQFGQWKDQINQIDNKNIDDKLNQPILVRKENSPNDLPPSLAGNALFAKSQTNGLLESNFDVNLLKCLSEVAYWTKIQSNGYITIPHNVQNLVGKKEDLRVMREDIMLIVRDYNTIIHTIEKAEKPLFKQHMDKLDMLISQGIKKKSWSQPIDKYAVQCRRQCAEVH